MNIPAVALAYIFLSLSVLAAAQAVHNDPITLGIGAHAPEFNLKGTDGKMYSLASFSTAKVLVIIYSANHCPTAQAYEDRIIAITKEYKPKGVEVVVISSNNPPAVSLSELGYTDLSDSYPEMLVRYRDKKFNFPYLYDGDNQKTALAYGPVATPHAFVFDSSRTLKYSGRIDGSEKPGTGHGEDLRNAINAVLAGKNPETATTKVFGCSMKWSWKKEYNKEQSKKWAEMPVKLDTISVDAIRELIRNKGEKLRLINVWATWCGPCTMEFPDFITIDRMYRGRDFEFISISADKIEKKDKVLRFLNEMEASNKNYLFSGKDIYQLVEAVDSAWQGALPYTMLVEPGGKVVYRQQGAIELQKMKMSIVDNPLIGRYY